MRNAERRKRRAFLLFNAVSIQHSSVRFDARGRMNAIEVAPTNKPRRRRLAAAGGRDHRPLGAQPWAGRVVLPRLGHPHRATLLVHPIALQLTRHPIHDLSPCRSTVSPTLRVPRTTRNSTFAACAHSQIIGSRSRPCDFITFVPRPVRPTKGGCRSPTGSSSLQH